jgi:uncharacterized protein with NRDE domain
VLSESPRAIGGRDLDKGGTWLGANAGGLFVGLTNQRTLRAPDKGRRSRGEVVLEALSIQTAPAAQRWLETLSPKDFNPFNLLFGTALDMRVAYFHEEMSAPEFSRVPSGVHVLPNDRLDSPAFTKVQRAKDLVEGFTDGQWPRLAGHLQRVLSDRKLPPHRPSPDPYRSAALHALEALCIRTPIYGTRSSAIVALTPGRTAHYLAASGAPDETAFRDHTASLYPEQTLS